MKKIFKRFSFIVAFFTFFFCVSQNAWATTYHSNYLGTNRSFDVNFQNLEFHDLTLIHYYPSGVEKNGIVGTVSNEYPKNVDFEVTVECYNELGTVVATSKKNFHLQAQETILYEQEITDFIGEYQVSDIYNYRMIVQMDDDSLVVYPSQLQPYQSYPYVIDSYDIQMIVNEDNTFDITETIRVYFNEERHGINREIPLTNTVTRENGKKTTNRAEISSIIVDNIYSVQKNYVSANIKIGNAKTTVTGKQEYVISYHYNIGSDPLKDSDEFYFNLIGSDWDTVIGNVTFSITMPKDFDATKLGFSHGTKGSIDSSDVEYVVENRVISGRYTGILKAGEALTIRLELEEGYFHGKAFSSGSGFIWMLVIPILSFLICFVLWFKYGRDDKVYETIEFYPPNDLNSVEIAFCYRGYAGTKDVISLLFYLANRGYIQIIEQDDDEFEIVKLKEYDGNNTLEETLLKGLFKKDHTKITSKQLKKKFNDISTNVLRKINTKENKNKIFEKNLFRNRGIVLSFIVLSLFTLMIIPSCRFADTAMIFISLFIAIFYIPFGMIGISNVFDGEANFVWNCITIFCTLPFFLFETFYCCLQLESIYLVALLVGISCVIGMVVLLILLPKRTAEGNLILGRILGFKKYLQLVNKEHLENMVTSNPSYWYDILPYTYVLGVSKKWMKRFEQIDVPMIRPDGMVMRQDFSIAHYQAFMQSTMKTMEHSGSSSSSGGSSYSSGGGSSGGGSGGGGGSSW